MVIEHGVQNAISVTNPFAGFSSQPTHPTGKTDARANDTDGDQTNGRARVLIVDDNPTNARVLAGMMEDRQFDFVLEADGKRAIERFTIEKFDLVFMDIHMPNIDGLEAAKQMREIEFEVDRPHTPILAVTAYDDPSVENSCEAVGMDGFIAKPVNAETLDRFLNIWIK